MQGDTGNNSNETRLLSPQGQQNLLSCWAEGGPSAQ